MGKNSKTLVIVTLCLLVFIDTIGMGIIWPLMPALFLDPHQGLVAHHTLLYRNTMYGCAFAAYPLAAFFGVPVTGALADSYGRRKIIILAVFGVVLGYALSILSVFIRDVHVFILSRAISGYFMGMSAIANAVILDISQTPEEKERYLQWPIVVGIIGGIAGPLVATTAGFSKNNNMFAPFVIAFFLSILNLFLVYFGLKETLEESKKKNVTIQRLSRETIRSVLYIFLDKRSQVLSMSYGIFELATGLFIQSIPLFLADQYQLGPGKIGVFFSLMALAAVIGMPVIGLITKYVRPLQQLAISIFLVALLLSILTIFFETHLLTKYIFFALSFAIFWILPMITVTFLSLYSDLTTKEENGRVMSGVTQISALAMGLGALSIAHFFSVHAALFLILPGIFSVVSIGFLFIGSSVRIYKTRH